MSIRGYSYSLVYINQMVACTLVRQYAGPLRPPLTVSNFFAGQLIASNAASNVSQNIILFFGLVFYAIKTILEIFAKNVLFFWHNPSSLMERNFGLLHSVV